MYSSRFRPTCHPLGLGLFLAITSLAAHAAEQSVTSQTAAPPPFYHDKLDLLHYLDDHGRRHPVTTSKEWRTRRQHILRNFELATGPLPGADRKVAQKTVSVALSPEHFEALQEAVTNERELGKTLQEMERVSRRIIFASAADTRRRKRLSKKVLGLI